MRRSLLALAALVSLLSGTSARADGPSVDLRGFRPSTDYNSAVYVEPTTTPGAGQWNVGVWTSYAYRLITLEGPDGDEAFTPVRHQLSLDYVAAIGVLDRFALGASLPTIIYQNGDDLERVGLGPGLSRTGIGDPALELKATLLRPDDVGGVGVAALGRFIAPFGSDGSYASEDAARGELRLLSELRLIALNVYATAGVRLRAEEREYFGQRLGHEAPWGFGLSVRPQAFGLDKQGRFRVSAELRGSVALTPEFGDATSSPLSTALSARYTVGNVSTLLGTEIALSSAIGDPTVRPVLAIAWAPRFYDADNDQIADDDDECVELAEDRDGFEDRDGCPDFDNDDDGVPDDEDRCPKEKEDEDENADDDGCIDPDDDKDGVPDAQDACPKEAAPATPDAKTTGCLAKDSDEDGVLDAADRCSKEPEDRDAFQDDDGCPDPDNDGDGVLDDEDACPAAAGQARSDASLNGCANPDLDGDTYDGGGDTCPKEAEDFNGDRDEDGCPDAAGGPAGAARALLQLDPVTTAIRLRTPIAFRATAERVEVEPKSVGVVRALARLLNQNPDWVLLVGVRPLADDAEAAQQALSKSFALVHLLRTLTHRDEAAESVAWPAVEKQPNARQNGVGLLVLKGSTLGPKPAKSAR
jgi:hypothetical protein